VTVNAGRSLLHKIDAKIEIEQKAGQSDNTPRFYCGASAIGKECARERWYDLRWASSRFFEARMLRLFDRGHIEEPRILEWLGSVGAEIRATSKKLMYHEGSDCYVLMDWDSEQDTFAGLDYLDDVTDLPWHVERAKRQGVELEQWGFKHFDGHFGGHCDGKLRFVPHQDEFVAADTWILGEFKTHNAKSFAELAGSRKDRELWLNDTTGTVPFPGKGVQTAHPKHVVQAQHYMHHLELPLALYAAVNKDDDDLHFEFIKYDPSFFHAGEVIIRESVHSPRPPRRSYASPSHYKCKMCDHRRTCQFGDPMVKNCRTCIHSYAAEEGNWRCRHWNNSVIPREAQLTGCGIWKQIED
jgi:hypothetical protein